MENWLLIFDIDDTLISSSLDFRKMKFHILSHLKMSTEKEENYSLIFEQLINSSNDAGIRKELWDYILQQEQIAIQSAKALPDMYNYLQRCHKFGYTCVGLTNNSSSVLQEKLEELNFFPYLNHVYYREDVKQMKPSPEGILHIIKDYNANKSYCVMIGDSWVDVKAAFDAQIHFLGIEWKKNHYLSHGFSNIQYLQLDKLIHEQIS